MKKIKEQPDTEVESRETYTDYQKKSGYPKENPRANPDSLDDDQGFYAARETENEVKGRVTKLLSLAKQILTEQQYNVFVMIAVKEPHFTEREAAKVLNVTPGRVHQLWDAARAKLQKAYTERV